MTIKLIAVSRATILQAQSRILCCESCSPEAEVPFDWLLDEITNNSGSEVDYLLSEPAKFFWEVTEKTLVAKVF